MSGDSHHCISDGGKLTDELEKEQGTGANELQARVSEYSSVFGISRGGGCKVDISSHCRSFNCCGVDAELFVGVDSKLPRKL